MVKVHEALLGNLDAHGVASCLETPSPFSVSESVRESGPDSLRLPSLSQVSKSDPSEQTQAAAPQPPSALLPATAALESMREAKMAAAPSAAETRPGRSLPPGETGATNVAATGAAVASRSCVAAVSPHPFSTSRKSSCLTPGVLTLQSTMHDSSSTCNRGMVETGLSKIPTAAAVPLSVTSTVKPMEGIALSFIRIVSHFLSLFSSANVVR